MDVHLVFGIFWHLRLHFVRVDPWLSAGIVGLAGT